MIGAEKAEIFPQPELNKSGNPVQVGSYRLMRSKLTNRLIVSRACEMHEESRDTTSNTTQVTHNRPNTIGEIVTTSDTRSFPRLSSARSGIEPANTKQESKLEKQ